MRCKREGCPILMPKPNTKEDEELMQKEWGIEGYCSESCCITVKEPRECPNCKIDMIYDPSNNEYVCPKCDN